MFILCRLLCRQCHGEVGFVLQISNMGFKAVTIRCRYSCTECEDWQKYTFSEPTLQVDGVLNEPAITTRIVR